MDTNNHGDLIRRPSSALAKRPEPLEPPMTPVADIYETADAFVIKLDMPGAEKESISVTIEPGMLAVKGKAESHKLINGQLVFSEIGRRIYERRFNLGEGVDGSKVEAQFENGVLGITIPKADILKAREINIK
ncbi:MAG TPA: Hsp20/alpha crystallin family protein [Bacteroidota bacterium]|nr:Hsp20/alpha crystallin family protein [Bacteroidota bacterium]